jgi:hypothetical protein
LFPCQVVQVSDDIAVSQFAWMSEAMKPNIPNHPLTIYSFGSVAILFLLTSLLIVSINLCLRIPFTTYESERAYPLQRLNKNFYLTPLFDPFILPSGILFPHNLHLFAI